MSSETHAPGACSHGRSGHGAYFDVDETLLAGKSMFAFLAHYLEEKGETPSTYRRLVSDLRRTAAAGAQREQVNRAYYELFRGELRERLTLSGLRWFEDNRDRPGFWNPGPVRELRRHREDGAVTVLLSGSFFACLDPLAAHLGADEVSGTRPVVRAGVLTGEVEQPMIGPAKAEFAHAHLTGSELCAECSHAYGDHHSDIALLESVGHPHVIGGGDPQLLAHADRHGWPALDPRPAPATDGHRRRRPTGHGDQCLCGCALADWSMEVTGV